MIISFLQISGTLLAGDRRKIQFLRLDPYGSIAFEIGLSKIKEIRLDWIRGRKFISP